MALSLRFKQLRKENVKLKFRQDFTTWQKGGRREESASKTLWKKITISTNSILSFD
jgi:hypothetical protein